MTHSSGLQYSYDDLDLVCCHGVDGKGPWTGAEASKLGRRTRCASMPEGRHQLPGGDLAQTAEVTASALNDETESKELKLMKSNVKVPQDLKEESVRGPHDSVDVDILRGASEADHLQTANCSSHAESRSDSNSGTSVANILCANDSSGRSETTIHGGDEVGTEGNQSHDPNGDNRVLKSPHITHEDEQCTTISSNNGSPLSESAGDQPGKRPNDQETKEGHIAGHSGPPQTSVSTPNQSSAAGLEPQTDLPDVQEEEISTSCNADARVILPAGVLGCMVTIMDTCGVMSQASEAVEPVMTLEVEKSCDRGESWSAGSADKLDGLNGPNTQNENAGLYLRDSQGKAQDQRNCTGEQFNVKAREDCAQAERSEEAADVGCGAITSSDVCFKGQCCSSTVKKLDAGYSEENHIKSHISHCVDQCLEMTTYASLPGESGDESSLSKTPACSLDQTVAQQLENSSIKLDTIPEVSHIEPDDIPVPDPLENSSLTPNPDVQYVHVDDKHTANDLDDKKLPPCLTEVCHALSPEELHSNYEAAGRYLSESPGSEVADGQREHHTPVAASSRMEDEAARTTAHSDTQLTGQPLDARNDRGDQKEESVVKVRLRKVRQFLRRLYCQSGLLLRLF